MRNVESSSRSCCREHQRWNLRLLRRARQFPLRSSAAVVFWPRWRPGWASSWPGNAAGSPRSPAPSEGPERPDADAAPPQTTCSPAHTHHLYSTLGFGNSKEQKQLTSYQAELSWAELSWAELSWAELLEQLNFKRGQKNIQTLSFQYDRQLLTISWTCVTYLTDLWGKMLNWFVSQTPEKNNLLTWSHSNPVNLLLLWLQLEADNHTTDIKDNFSSAGYIFQIRSHFAL